MNIKMDTTPSKTLSLRINLETPASSILPENPLDSLHNVLEKLASKRRTASDNLFPLQNQEDHSKNYFFFFVLLRLYYYSRF